MAAGGKEAEGANALKADECVGRPRFPLIRAERAYSPYATSRKFADKTNRTEGRTKHTGGAAAEGRTNHSDGAFGSYSTLLASDSTQWPKMEQSVSLL